MDLGGQPQYVQDDSYIESSSFVGPREGYYFGTGSLGTGYYRSRGGEDASQGRSTKRKRNEDGDHRQMRGEDLLELLERQSGRVVKEIDGAGLERLLRALEKKFNANVERRIQYADEPQKFMESEVELDEAVKGLHVCECFFFCVIVCENICTIEYCAAGGDCISKLVSSPGNL